MQNKKDAELEVQDFHKFKNLVKTISFSVPFSAFITAPSASFFSASAVALSDGTGLPSILMQEQSIKKNPPNTLIFEGGSVVKRIAATLFWTLFLNCKSVVSPCFECLICQQLFFGVLPDFFFLDGQNQNIKIEQVRQVRSAFGEAPRLLDKRVVVIAEAQKLGIEAANSLLKVLEEPSSDTVFVLTCPQREQLLLTFVSRSWVLTLPWLENKSEQKKPDESQKDKCSVGNSELMQHSELVEHSVESETLENKLFLLQQGLIVFLKTGKGWFKLTEDKGFIDLSLAGNFLVYCQRALTIALGSHNYFTENSSLTLAEIFKTKLDLKRLRLIDEVITHCRNALDYAVNPALVLDWLATGIFIYLEEYRRNKD